MKFWIGGVWSNPSTTRIAAAATAPVSKSHFVLGFISVLDAGDLAGHSYRRASIGSSKDALRAG